MSTDEDSPVAAGPCAECGHHVEAMQGYQSIATDPTKRYHMHCAVKASRRIEREQARARSPVEPTLVSGGAPKEEQAMGTDDGFDRHERHADDWHEWSLGIGDGINKGKPARLFVRFDGGSLGSIELTESNVTSFSAEARQLEGPSARSRTLHLTGTEAEFLLEVLPRALAEKHRNDRPGIELGSHARAEQGGDDVERVARALAEESHRQLMRALESKDEHWEEDYRELARAALSAIPRDERAIELAREILHLLSPSSRASALAARGKAYELVGILEKGTR